MNIQKIKRDFAKHRAKTMVLGILALVMIGMFVKAGMEMRPRAAAAESVMVIPEVGADITVEGAGDADSRIHESRELWKVLRGASGGLDAANAFTFDPTYFPMDPSKQYSAPASRVEPERVSTPQVVVNTEQLERSARISGIREQARSLVVRSTVVGNGNSQPVAVINDQILTVGDRISGFEIMAIRAREVEFKKEGITLAVKMADQTPGQ